MFFSILNGFFGGIILHISEIMPYFAVLKLQVRYMMPPLPAAIFVPIPLKEKVKPIDCAVSSSGNASEALHL